MRNVRWIAFGLAAFVALSPALSHAQVRPWIQGSFGGSTYAMGDVNDEIGMINSGLAGSGLSMEEVTKGMNLGLAVGLDLASGFTVGAGWDRLFGKSDVGDWSGSLTYDLPANLFRGFGRYTFASATKTQGFLEASVGGIVPAGKITLSITGVGSDSGNFGGSGVAFEGGGGVNFWLAPQFAISGAAGYRHAVAGKIEVDGQRVYNADGSNYEIDYSGLFLRVGLTAALTP